MKKTTVKVPDELWKRFQVAVAQKYGRTYGNIQKALTEAIEEWVKKMEARPQ